MDSLEDTMNTSVVNTSALQGGDFDMFLDCLDELCKNKTDDKRRKLGKKFNCPFKAVNCKRHATSDLSSTDDAISLDPPKRKRYKKNRSKGDTFVKCSKCDEKFKCLLLLAKHKCVRSAKSKQRFSSTKIPRTAAQFNSSSPLSSSSSAFSSIAVLSSTKLPMLVNRNDSSSSGYEMSPINDPIERMDFSNSIESVDSTECSMDGYETAHSIDSSAHRSSLGAIDETDESCYETASSNLSSELQTDEMSNRSSEPFEWPYRDVRLPEIMPSGFTAVEQFPIEVDSLFDSNTGIPVIRNASFSHANNSQIINGIVHDQNFTTLSSHLPTLIEKKFELITYIQLNTPLLNGNVPTWPTTVEPFKVSTSSHASQNSSPSPPSFGGLFENESISTVQEFIDERIDIFNEMPNVAESLFNSDTKQIGKNQTASSESESSLAIDSTADSGMDSLEFDGTTYRAIFSSTYLIDQVKRIVNNKRKEFSISKCLPLPLKMAVCECCLCCIRQKNNQEIELSERFCICKDPLKRKCTEKYSGRKRDSIYEKSNRSCKHCLYMMVTSSERNHQTKLIKCGMMPCNFTAKRPSTMEQHYKKHLNIRNFECLICAKGFQAKSILRKHGRSHLHSKKCPFSSSSTTWQSI